MQYASFMDQRTSVKRGYNKRLRVEGKISSWNDEKGYGFIEPTSGGKRIFFHIKSIYPRNRRPRIDQIVSYVLSKDKQGRPCALHITYTKPEKTKKPSGIAVTVVVSFFATLSILTCIHIIPPIVIAWYTLLCVITYVTYAIDKTAAQTGGWRTSEATLHSLASIGGWPGALIAQQILHHKSRKQEFQFVYKITVIFNLVLITWLIMSDGPELFQYLQDQLMHFMNS